MEDDKNSFTKNGSSITNNSSSKSWIHLKWNNPENVNRISPTKTTRRRPRNAKICRKCGRSYKNNACPLCQEIDCSKIFRHRKLPITKIGKGGAQSSPEEISPIGTGSTSLDRRLLKEHWWRCDGPCQYKMPFFGLVRRAINRAPGPNDKWWSSHAKTCGGTFIKVKEPSENKSESDGLRNGDIRNFLAISKNNLESSSSEDSGRSIQVFAANLEDSGANLETSSSNLESPGSNPEDSCSNLDISDSNLENFDSNPEDSGFNLEDSSASTCNNTKCSIDDTDDPFSLLFTDEIFDESQSETLKECSFCAKKVKSFVFEEHENECMTKACDNAEETIEISCISCGKDIPKSERESHLKDCLNEIFEEDFDTRQEEKPKFTCPLCMTLVPENFMKTHLDLCLSTSKDPIIESLTFP